MYEIAQYFSAEARRTAAALSYPDPGWRARRAKFRETEHWCPLGVMCAVDGLLRDDVRTPLAGTVRRAFRATARYTETELDTLEQAARCFIHDFDLGDIQNLLSALDVADEEVAL